LALEIEVVEGGTELEKKQKESWVGRNRTPTTHIKSKF
jgi:hypothetical protein